MSKIVKIISRRILDAVFKDALAVRSMEAVVNFCIDAIPSAVQVEIPTNGSTVTVNYIKASEFYNVWLLLKPATTLTSLTVVFPAATGLNAAIQGQEVMISADKSITGLVLNPNGGTILNAITSVNTGTTTKYKFSGGVWYKTS
jgi:hypothetical protein